MIKKLPDIIRPNIKLNKVTGIDSVELVRRARYGDLEE